MIVAGALMTMTTCLNLPDRRSELLGVVLQVAHHAHDDAQLLADAARFELRPPRGHEARTRAVAFKQGSDDPGVRQAGVRAHGQDREHEGPHLADDRGLGGLLPPQVVADLEEAHQVPGPGDEEEVLEDLAELGHPAPGIRSETGPGGSHARRRGRQAMLAGELNLRIARGESTT